MRIIAGTYRGRRLAAPEGADTRPTTDRSKESLMSSIVSRIGSFEGTVVLDAFAGSGSLGLEALSRGAGIACFCETSQRAKRAIEQNISSLHIPQGQAVVRTVNVLKALPPRLGEPYDIVFLDPPYTISAHSVVKLIARMDEAGLLAKDVLISYEHSITANATLTDALSDTGFVKVVSKTFKKTAIDLIERS
ncbi:MAG: 16S rRNA (guanine(966)-N(2))-methyltransferase RsmD [Eggerthellaceae bacterium]|nr:16S rRNA (guanine(966)-N(2))-methyltransferase RsmD [Eggerthellaceae bacterium]